MRSKSVRRGLGKSALLEIANIFGAEQSKSLTFKLPSSRVSFNRDLPRDIQEMREIAARHRMLYLTANQVESLHRLFLINRLHDRLLLTHPDYSNPADYQSFINPTVVASKGEPAETEEQCLAIPFITFLVPRFPQIELEWWDENREPRREAFEGSMAYLIQHCINHLDGQMMLDYELSHGRFYVHKDIASHFPKTSFLLKEYSLRLKSHHDRVAKGEATLTDEKFVAMKNDYIERLKGEYDKENRAFSKQVENRRNILNGNG